MLIFVDSAAELGMHLSGTAAKLLLVLPSKLDWRVWRTLSQMQAAVEMGLSQSQISRALNELLRYQVVERRGKKGTAAEWRLSRSIGYRGRAAQYHADERAEAAARAAEQSDGSKPPEAAQGALRRGLVRGGRRTSNIVAVVAD